MSMPQPPRFAAFVAAQFAAANVAFVQPDFDLLVRDLWDMIFDEPRWQIVPFADAYNEWIRRIGGTGNLPAYLASLQAGERLRNSPRIARL